MAVVVETFPSPREAAREAADAIAAAVRDAVAQRGRATFVASGGRTPEPVYDILSRAVLPWDKVTVTLTDERWVDPHSAESNERMVRDRLLTENAAAAAFAPLKSAHATPHAALDNAVARLGGLFLADVVLLGMGEDGHVASLFPGGPVLAEGLVAAIDAREPAPPQPRLSLTMQALQPRRLTVLLISGKAKRHVLEEGEDLPVHLLLEHAKAPVRVLWSP
ncbi:MAG TPA: 6-phosphogluconolactonase [Caulobacteraceae bacterium]|nr:6-phosphogluconolactonase [Caulobacteraceae bacterium]